MQMVSGALGSLEFRGLGFRGFLLGFEGLGYGFRDVLGLDFGV